MWIGSRVEEFKKPLITEQKLARISKREQPRNLL
jgi:hypothetical protein